MGRDCKTLSEHVLTEGGLVRTLKAGCPEQTMHLRWTGAAAPQEIKVPLDSEGKFGEPEEFLDRDRVAEDSGQQRHPAAFGLPKK